VLVFGVGDAYCFIREVDAADLGMKEIDVPQHFANRVHYMGEIDIAGGHFVQHRGEEDEVFAVDESDFQVIAAGEDFVEFQGRIEAAESAAENENALFHAY